MRPYTVAIGIFIMIIALFLFGIGLSKISDADSTIYYYENTPEGKKEIEEADWDNLEPLAEYDGAYEQKNLWTVLQLVEGVLFFMSIAFILYGLVSSPKKNRSINEIAIIGRDINEIQAEIGKWLDKNKLKIIINTTNKIIAKGNFGLIFELNISKKDGHVIIHGEYYLKNSEGDEWDLTGKIPVYRIKAKQIMESFISYLKSLSINSDTVSITASDSEE